MSRIDKWDSMKLRSFCIARTVREREKILANYISDRLYKELKKPSSKSNNPINNWAKEMKLGSEDNVQQTHEKMFHPTSKYKFTLH